MDFEQGLNDEWNAVATFVPRFLLILVVGWFIAKAVAKAVDVILERVGFDRAVERGGVARALERSTYDASDIVAKLVFDALLLVTLVLAFNAFGPNPRSATCCPASWRGCRTSSSPSSSSSWPPRSPRD